jgi:hypothetical protein
VKSTRAININHLLTLCLGKTTVAHIYAKFLNAVGVLSSSKIEETSGTKLADEGPQAAQNLIHNLLAAGGGILFVDEAYQLTAPCAPTTGRQVLHILLTAMEKHSCELVVIFVGYKKEMESFFENNPGLARWIPYTMRFHDFDNAELWSILCDNINKKYRGKMEVEDGMYGLYMRVAIRRLARGRGVRGFGNARSVHNLLAQISERQAKRLAKQLRSRSALNQLSDFFFLTKEDLIGPKPSTVESAAYAKLQELIGLESVKHTAKSMIDMIETNYLREIAEKKPLEFSLNRVFYGSPGTGKTTVAKLYGQLLADLGLLSNGEGQCSVLKHFTPSHAGMNSLLIAFHSGRKKPRRLRWSMPREIRGQNESHTCYNSWQSVDHRRGLYAKLRRSRR